MSPGRAFAALLAALLAAGCATQTTRFALRAPVLREPRDVRTIAAPAFDEEQNDANALDVIAFRPLSHAFLLPLHHEATNVSSLDEVPDSTWFVNRVVTPDELARGACPDDGPVPPLVVVSVKSGGTTPGMVVTDARGQRYMVKLDDNAPEKPEITTAAEAIVSRLYWAIGFNAPCDVVVMLPRDAVRITAASYEKLPWGDRRPLHQEGVTALLSLATPGQGATVRMSANRWIEGQGIGTWRTEGRRVDDPNDRIPHEDRRELRGERLLAAWTSHWDSRGPNTFDAFARGADGLGHVVHYFNDFNEALGGTPIRTAFPEPRMGFVTVANVPVMLQDIGGFGFVRRPWDDVSVDPRFPNAGYFDVAHFDPLAFSPQTPLVRWARADDSDLGWMARRMARLSQAHVRVAVTAGKLSSRAEEEGILAILMGRRDKVLRAAFARSSALSDVALVSSTRLCALDLALSALVSAPADVSYRSELRVGAQGAMEQLPMDAAPGGGLCVTLPHRADRGSADDALERYATLDLLRWEHHERTVLRVHLYDLGPARGFFLAGVERLR